MKITSFLFEQKEYFLLLNINYQPKVYVPFRINSKKFVKNFGFGKDFLLKNITIALLPNTLENTNDLSKDIFLHFKMNNAVVQRKKLKGRRDSYQSLC